MAHGTRNARIALVVVAGVFTLAWVVGLIEGRVTQALSAIPVFVFLIGAVRSYRADPAGYHEPMTRGEIARAVLPLVVVVVLIVVGSTVAVLIDR
jgi:hypothetical protein